ncbi:hypothetical protein M430DRAFT_176728 [Amorphotheca resinae ATCC 22711]|jgi:hypothetical protein|uniref:Uncharacterized protein n=1 Tax=Amorphotheca resinae ATCC 22711 TaxID=857342 RepID=A0A2T3AT35_AMORE|nr:hypothetical protein M430DRAFT_176728 [Amorphotheca resinae ATCC 22711]PSS10611.1 hypothetical protein M430DRAFT_176728 [Amorphotheca resinae ATCC 22711]
MPSGYVLLTGAGVRVVACYSGPEVNTANARATTTSVSLNRAAALGFEHHEEDGIHLICATVRTSSFHFVNFGIYFPFASPMPHGIEVTP